MPFNGWTFALEIVNFLVLVWLLHRLLYRPVLAAIARRRAAIEGKLSAAETALRQAEQRKTEYDQRLADWAEERAAARHALDEELEAERRHRVELLAQELVAQRERTVAVAQRQGEQARREVEDRALQVGAAFVARLLGALADQHLEARLIKLVLTELTAPASDRRQLLQAGLRDANLRVQVTTAYPLAGEQRAAVEQALATLAGGTRPTISFEREPALMAGLRVAAGAWQFGANLQDELRAFIEMAHTGA